MYAYLVIIFYLLCLVTIFPYYPILGDKLNLWLLHNKWNHSDWATFLAGILGFAGAFVALYGIKWQVTRSEKQKEKEKIKSFLEGVKDHLDRCLLSKKINRIALKSFMVFSYSSTTFGHNEESKLFYPLENHGITFTYNIIYNFDEEFRKILLDVEDRILAYNKHYSFLFSHLNLKKEFISNLQKNTPKKIQDIALSLEKVSYVLQGICLSYSKDYLDHHLSILYNSSKIKKDTKEKMKTLNLETESKEAALLLVDELVCFSERLWVELFLRQEKMKEKYEQISRFYMSESQILELDVYDIINRMKNLKIKVEKELEKYN